MPLILVTYDLNKEKSSENYNNVLNVIKSEKNWARLSESCYVMDTNLTPQQIYSKVKPFLDTNDMLLAFPIKKPYFGQHSKEVIDWLSKKITL
jgi:hypothetical protein